MRGMTKFGWLISEPFGFVTSQPRLNLSQASLWAQHWDKAWQLGMGSKEAASKYFSIVFVFLYYCINISLLFIIVIIYFCISISLLEWRDLLKIWGRRLSAFVEEWGGRPHSHSQHHGIMRCSGTYCLLFVILSIVFTFKVRLQQHSILTAFVLVQNFTGNVH